MKMMKLTRSLHDIKLSYSHSHFHFHSLMFIITFFLLLFLPPISPCDIPCVFTPPPPPPPPSPPPPPPSPVVEVIYSMAGEKHSDGNGTMEILHFLLIFSIFIQIAFISHRLYHFYWGDGKEKRMQLKERRLDRLRREEERMEQRRREERIRNRKMKRKMVQEQEEEEERARSRHMERMEDGIVEELEELDDSDDDDH